jgi:hypothetical protein
VVTHGIFEHSQLAMSYHPQLLNPQLLNKQSSLILAA